MIFPSYYCLVVCADLDHTATMAFLSTAILALVVLVTTTFFLPRLAGALLGLVFRGAGWLIRRRTRSRRDYVIARARSDEEEYRAAQPQTSTNSLARSQAEDEDWEKVDSSGGAKTATSSDSGDGSKNEGASSDDWDGIIGFFHPFWYDIHILPM